MCYGATDLGNVYVPTINASWHIVDYPTNTTCQARTNFCLPQLQMGWPSQKQHCQIQQFVLCCRCGTSHHRKTAETGECTVQVLVQGHLLLPSDVTTDNIIGDDPPGINADRQAATAYPVPTSHAFAVNMTVVTQNTQVGKVRYYRGKEDKLEEVP